jgi:hypothetical protein
MFAFRFEFLTYLLVNFIQEPDLISHPVYVRMEVLRSDSFFNFQNRLLAAIAARKQSASEAVFKVHPQLASVLACTEQRLVDVESGIRAVENGVNAILEQQKDQQQTLAVIQKALEDSSKSIQNNFNNALSHIRVLIILSFFLLTSFLL